MKNVTEEIWWGYLIKKSLRRSNIYSGKSALNNKNVASVGCSDHIEVSCSYPISYETCNLN